MHSKHSISMETSQKVTISFETLDVGDDENFSQSHDLKS